MIDPPSSSTARLVVGSPLTLSCTSQGSPPDTFSFLKDGIQLTPSPSVTAVVHTDSMAVFQIEYSVNNITTSDSGTYTCTVTNPIGSDSENFTVTVVGKCDSCMHTCMSGAKTRSTPLTQIINWPRSYWGRQSAEAVKNGSTWNCNG